MTLQSKDSKGVNCSKKCALVDWLVPKSGMINTLLEASCIKWAMAGAAAATLFLFCALAFVDIMSLPAMHTPLGVGIGMVTGLLSTYFYVAWGRDKYTPRFTISEKIARRMTSSGRNEFRMKVVNRCKCKIYSVRARLYALRPLEECPSLNHYEPIELQKDEAMIVDEIGGGDNEDACAWRFITHEKVNLDTVLKKHSVHKLKLIVSAVSAIGNIMAAKPMIYTAEDIKTGYFELGESLTIVSQD